MADDKIHFSNIIRTTEDNGEKFVTFQIASSPRGDTIKKYKHADSVGMYRAPNGWRIGSCAIPEIIDNGKTFWLRGYQTNADNKRLRCTAQIFREICLAVRYWNRLVDGYSVIAGGLKKIWQNTPSC